jgi:hypothetical protein
MQGKRDDGYRRGLRLYRDGVGALRRWASLRIRRLVTLWRSLVAPRRRVRLPRRSAV